MNFLEISGILFWVLVGCSVIFYGVLAIGAKSEEDTKETMEQQYRKKYQASPYV